MHSISFHFNDGDIKVYGFNKKIHFLSMEFVLYYEIIIYNYPVVQINFHFLVCSKAFCII